jgi:hypothetical protein
MTDLRRNFISVGCDDRGKRIRETVSEAILFDSDRLKKETLPGFRFSLKMIETRALALMDALVSQQEGLVKAFFVTLLYLPRTRIDDLQHRHLAFGDNEFVHAMYYMAIAQILKDQIHASHALFHSEIGDVVANNKKVEVFPGEVDSLYPGQRLQCHFMEKLVSKELLIAMGRGLNRYIDCLTNLTDRMDEKQTPVGIPRVEINTIYQLTLPELTDAAVNMKSECRNACHMPTDDMH